MPMRLISHAALAALVVAFAAGSVVAQPAVGPQLTITASPDPAQTVAGKTVLTFSAKVFQSGHAYRVELGSQWSTEWRTPGIGHQWVALPFTAKYSVPSSVKPGAQLCFSLMRITDAKPGHKPSWTEVAMRCRKATHDRLPTDRAARAAFVNQVMPLGLDALDLDAVRAAADRMAAAGAYFCPTLHVAEAWRVEHPSLPGFTPENPERHWNGFADVATRITQVFAERGVKLLIGQDGVDPAGTLREMELLVKIGVAPVDVLRAATLHPAQWLKRDHEIGSLEVKRRADLVLVGADPVVDMTTLRSPVLVVQAGTVRRRGDLSDRTAAR